MIGFVIGEMPLEVMEVVVDVADQADPARQQVHGADAARGEALDAIGEFDRAVIRRILKSLRALDHHYRRSAGGEAGVVAGRDPTGPQNLPGEFVPPTSPSPGASRRRGGPWTKHRRGDKMIRWL